MAEEEEPMLVSENGGDRKCYYFPEKEKFVRELKRMCWIAFPMVVVSLSQYMLRAVSLMMLGHLSKLALSSVSIASSFTNVTGFSVLTQSFIFPMVFSSLATLCIHLPLSWAIIFKLEFGNAGAAFCIGISYWLNVIFIGLYIYYSSACEKTRSSFSRDVFQTFAEFFRFAIPSSVMICLEWWTFEIVILLAGILSNPKLETSVLSICLTITSLHYLVQYSFGAAASTRVSNELGAVKSEAAQLAVSAVLVISTVEFVVASITLFLCRYILGYLFSNEKDVVDYVKDMTPFLCASIVMDSIQATLSGVARGSGWQHLGAFVNLGAYYLVGIPVSLLLGIVLHFRGKGLWSGLVAGATVQSSLLVFITFRTDWKKQAMEARQRMFEGKIPAGDDRTVDAEERLLPAAYSSA